MIGETPASHRESLSPPVDEILSSCYLSCNILCHQQTATVYTGNNLGGIKFQN